MEPTTIALSIIVIGTLLIIGETVSPGVYFIIPGTVMVVLGIVGYIIPDFLFSIWAPITMALVGLVVSIATIMIYKKLGNPEPPVTAVSDGLIGKIGTITISTAPDNISGKVKIGSELWSARSLNPIAVGTVVRVVSTEGVHVVVEEISEE
jgi:membrane protein implicated in regulation of membrane protease activity